MTSYIVLFALWLFWCFVHSALISRSVTTFCEMKLGPLFRFHRIAYNLFALVTLIPIALYERSMESPLVFRWTGPTAAVQVLLIISSLLLFLGGGRHYDGLTFLGLRQIGVGGRRSLLTPSGRLEMDGILHVTRHPWYLGAILLVWSRNLWLSTLITNIILTVYILIGTILEERKLVAEFGDEYRRYQSDVSMLFPFRWFGSRRLRR